MKTPWGGRNPESRSNRVNTELGKKPRECLEYIVVNELVRLLERNDTDRFAALMDHSLPHWREPRKLLNTAPLGHESWLH